MATRTLEVEVFTDHEHRKPACCNSRGRCMMLGFDQLRGGVYCHITGQLTTDAEGVIRPSKNCPLWRDEGKS